VLLLIAAPVGAQTIVGSDHDFSGEICTPYSSATLEATVGQPDGSSKLCLSCHDGTVAVDNYGGQTGGAEFVAGNELIGTDLANDHPVSFTYDAALATADGDLSDPTTTNSGLGGTITADMLIGGKMQCASCHDVHDSFGLAYLLKKSNAASALCLTCHTK
jgi:predicted CXXCH cytochrome family protein